MKQQRKAKQGAANQSWNRSNPRPLLERLINEHDDPRDEETKEEIFNDLSSSLFALENRDMLLTALRYWFDNNYAACMRAKFGDNDCDRVVNKDRIKAQISMRLLDSVMPNGKKLRECTFGDAIKFGGWIAKIGEYGRDKPTKIIGHFLNDRKAKELIEPKSKVLRLTANRKAA